MITFPLRCIYVNYINWIEVSVTPGIYNPLAEVSAANNAYIRYNLTGY